MQPEKTRESSVLGQKGEDQAGVHQDTSSSPLSHWQTAEGAMVEESKAEDEM